jgi:HK97 family phage major capsid protein
VTLQLRQRFDSQILNGNGTSPNLKGLLNVSGIQTYAKAAEDNDFDTVMQAINKVRVTAFAEPNAIIMHPTDWMKLLLIRVNGIYVMGYPGQESAPRLWGLPVVTTTYKGSGSALVADFANFVEIWYRLGILFSYTNSHASEFTSGIQRMRAEMRAGLVVTRPAALCTATGLTGA